MDDRAGGNASGTVGRGRSGEDVIGFSLLVLGGGEALGLKVEHRAVATALGHELVVRAELDDPAVFEHADAVGVADRRKAMRDEDGGAVTTGSQDAVEDLGLAADVELGRWFIEQHDAGAELYGTQGSRQRDTLPLPARKIGTAFVAFC